MPTIPLKHKLKLFSNFVLDGRFREIYNMFWVYPLWWNRKTSEFLLNKFLPSIGVDLFPPFLEIEPTADYVKYKITTPSEFTLGAALDLHIVNVSAQATFIDYSQMEFSGNLNKDLINGNNKIIKENFRPVLNSNIGAEVKIPFTEIRGRAGLMYLPSPYVDDPKNFNRIYLTLGAGIVAGQTFKFDVAYSYGFWETYGDNYSIDQSRIFQEIDSHTILITTTIMF